MVKRLLGTLLRLVTAPLMLLTLGLFDIVINGPRTRTRSSTEAAVSVSGCDAVGTRGARNVRAG